MNPRFVVFAAVWAGVGYLIGDSNGAVVGGVIAGAIGLLLS